jgi:hypothetical protein
MKKYKLIKKYPGSPSLGTICEERNNKSSFCYYFEGEKNLCILKDEVENQPEYWQEVDVVVTELVVFTEENNITKEIWTPILLKRLKEEIYLGAEKRFVFKTREEADDFIFYNKPTLSYNDVLRMFCESRDFIGDVMTFRVSKKSLDEFVKYKTC